MQNFIARGLAILILVSLGAAQGVGSRDQIQNLNAATQTPATPHAKAFQVGTASWYGDYFEGRQTASGQPFNMYDLTAAHPTLPLGTLVKVTNLRNKQAVVVRINDRGPYVGDRIIDLSYSAAKVLHFKEQGIQRVRLDVIHPRPHGEIMAALAPIQR
jgi:rare lipoprotein A